MKRGNAHYRYFVGLDMGSSLVKLVLLKHRKDRLAIEGCGLFSPSSSSSFGGGSEGRFSPESISKIRRSLEGAGLLGLPAASNIEDPSLRIRRVDLPRLPEDEILPAVRFRLREVVEGSIDDYVVRTSPLPSEGTQMSRLVYAIKREAVERQFALVEAIGLTPVTIEPSAVSLLRMCDFVYGFEAEARYALVDFGMKVSAFTVMEKGSLLFSRPLSGICEHALIKLISRNLEIDREAAAKRLSLYRQHMALQAKGDGTGEVPSDERLHITIQHYFSQILLEIERSIDAFCLMFQTENLPLLYISGGASHLPLLTPYLEGNLSLKLRLVSPFGRLKIFEAERSRLSQFSYLFAVAIGLSLLAEGGRE